MTKKTKRCFTPAERVSEAIARGIEPFIAQRASVEKQIMDRALACKTNSQPFWEAHWYFARTGPVDARLLDKFLSFSRREQMKKVGVLADFYDEPRVRRTMIALARGAKGAAFSAFATTLGSLGGRGVRTLLDTRLRELSSAVRKAPSRASSDLVDACAETASVILQLDPDATKAADVLIWVHRERARFSEDANNDLALAFLREALLLHSRSRTTALRRIRAVLRELLDPSANENDFAYALPALSLIDAKAAMNRAKVALLTDEWLTRVMSAQELAKKPFENSWCLLEYLKRHPEDHGVIDRARDLGPAVPNHLRMALVERQLEDPSARSRADAAQYLAETEGGKPVEVARRFAASEPEPLVKHILLGRVGSDRKLNKPTMRRP